MNNDFLESVGSHIRNVTAFLKGGKGSGFYGHAGRDAENLRGGSVPRQSSGVDLRDVRKWNKTSEDILDKELNYEGSRTIFEAGNKKVSVEFYPMKGSLYHQGHVVIKIGGKKYNEGTPAEMKLWLRKEYGIHWTSNE